MRVFGRFFGGFGRRLSAVAAGAHAAVAARSAVAIAALGLSLGGVSANARVINEFAGQWDFAREAVIIDVRTPAEWAQGVLPGAQQISIIDAAGRPNERFYEQVQEIALANGALELASDDGAAATGGAATGGAAAGDTAATGGAAAGGTAAVGDGAARRLVAGRKPLLLVCHSGARSARAAALLAKRGYPGLIINLQGGMLGIPATVPLVK